jgi:hypothetical protein
MANSYKDMARRVQRKGTTNSPGDTMLAHITPKEAGLLKMFGGSGRMDPHTGIPHFEDGEGSPSDGAASDSGAAASDSGSASTGSDAGFGGVGDMGFGDPGVTGENGGNAGGTPSDMGFGDPSVTGENGPSFGGFGTSDVTADYGVDSFSETGFDSTPMGQAMHDVLSQPPDEDTPFGKFGKAIQSFAVNTAIGKGLSALGLNGIQGVAGIAGKGAKGNTPGVVAGMMSGVLGLANPALGAINGLMGNPMGNAVGQAFGGVNNSSMNGQGAATASANAANGSTGGLEMGDLMGGLAGLYMGNRSQKQYDGAMGDLNSIFSPNSVYAQQLRQNLERKDAAAGRRSQYGPREAQLMAALAERQAQTMSSPGYGAMMGNRERSQNQGLITLLGLGQKSGLFNKAGQHLGNGIQGAMAGGGLESLFNGGYSDNWNWAPNEGPQMDSGQGDFGLFDGFQ